jgi:hypothetical protein
MLTAVWNPRGFHLTDVRVNGRKCNSLYYVTETLSPLSKWHSADAKGEKRKLTLHADDARLPTAEPSAQLFHQNRKETGLILRIHLTSHDPIFTSFVISRDVWQVSGLRAQINLSKQFSPF